MNRLMLAILISGLAACDNDGPLEQVGEEIDEASEDIQVQGETTANEIDDAIDDIEQAAEDAVE
jgi:predicted small lipoprotein YifL